MRGQKIKLLAMPKIGTGLDKMSWEVVRSMIFDVFKDKPITILVCGDKFV